MTTDVRLLPIVAGVWIGCALGLHLRIGWALAAVVLGMLVLAWMTRRVVPIGPAIVVGCVLAVLRVSAADPMIVADAVRNAGAVDVRAVVNGQPQLFEHRGFGGLETEREWRSAVTLTRIDTDERVFDVSIPATLRWSAPGIVPEVGSTVRVNAVLHPDDAARRSVYRVAARGAPRIVAAASRGSRLANRIRNGLGTAIGSHAPSARAGATLLPGLVLGDTSAQPANLVDDLRTSGLSHLTAVSGANVAIVLGAVMWMLQRTRLPRRYRYATQVLVLLAFVVVVQPQPSVLRAAFMGAIAVYALATGRAAQSASVLWLSVLLLLIVDPFLAWQYGFALSVAATAGLIVLQPWLAAHLPDHPAMHVLLVTLAAQIATLPVLVLMGRPPTWVGVPANLLAAPLVAPATVSGFVATLLAAMSLLPIAPGMFELLARVVATPGVLIGDVIAFVADRAAHSVFAVSPFASWGSTAAFVVFGLALWLLRRHRRLALILGLLYALVAFAPTLLPGGWPPSGWWYVMCDIGQGDASVIRGRAGGVVVIDAGPDPRALRRCLQQLHVRRIDALILTHFHADHVEGVSAVAGVRRVFVSPQRAPLVEYQRVQTELQVPMTVVQRGDRITVGDMQFDVLWPTANGLSGNPNTDSLVMLLHAPQGTVLLGADADDAAQSQFDPRPATVLKVPHHGSRYQSADFLRGVGAALSLVSVGAGNDYGHPAASTVDLLRGGGSRVLRTDLVGSIALTNVDGRLSVATER